MVGESFLILFFRILLQPKREAVRRIVPTSQLISAPILDAQVKIESPQPKRVIVHTQSPVLVTSIIPKQEKSTLMAELDWNLDLEYDPMIPSDYDKISRGNSENITCLVTKCAILFQICREKGKKRDGN